MSANKFVIALDVGGSSIKSGLVESNDSIIGTTLLSPIDSSAPAQKIIGSLSEVIRTYLANVNREDLLGIAIGFPGPFDYENSICLIEGLCKFGSIYGVNVRDALTSELNLDDCPIVFRNDAEAAILGEAVYGAGRRFNRLIGITLGTGFGSCFVVDGSPVISGAGVPPDGGCIRFHIAMHESMIGFAPEGCKDVYVNWARLLPTLQNRQSGQKWRLGLSGSVAGFRSRARRSAGPGC